MKSTYCPLNSAQLNTTVPDGFIQVFPELYECMVNHFSYSKEQWANLTQHIGTEGLIVGCKSKSGRYYLNPEFLTLGMLSFNYEPDVIPENIQAYRNDSTFNPKDQFTSVKPDPQTT